MENMQWIKVFTDIFANPKIKILLKERDGDTFFRVWIQLLTIAGQCMQEGKLMISENNPMTVHELATIIHKTDAKMENILNKLIHLEMLIYQENTYIIKNWYKYQSIDKYEKILEQNRARQKRFRDKKKEESNVTQTSSNVEEENITEKNKIWLKKYVPFIKEENCIILTKEIGEYSNENRNEIKGKNIELRQKDYDKSIMLDDEQVVLREAKKILNDKIEVFHISSALI